MVIVDGEMAGESCDSGWGDVKVKSPCTEKGSFDGQRHNIKQVATNL